MGERNIRVHMSWMGIMELLVAGFSHEWLRYSMNRMLERKGNEWHHIPRLFIVLCCTFCMTKRGWGGSIYFEKASEGESGISVTSCLLYCTSLTLPAIYFFNRNKAHILSVWVFTSGKLSTADVSKIYTSISVQLTPILLLHRWIKMLFLKSLWSRIQRWCWGK